MKYYDFGRCETFDSESQLRQRLCNNTICLAPNSRIKFEGRIGLANNIEFEGFCFLGCGSSLASGSSLKNVTLGKNNQVRQNSIMIDCEAGDNNIFGPFCFVRDFCSIGNRCIVGSYVEMTRSSISDGVSISHQAFVGDALIESDVIIGAGVVFCNHNNQGKVSSIIGSSTLIGSGSMLIAPTEIGSHVIVGAGSLVKGVVQSGSKVIQKRGQAS